VQVQPKMTDFFVTIARVNGEWKIVFFQGEQRVALTPKRYDNRLDLLCFVNRQIVQLHPDFYCLPHPSGFQSSGAYVATCVFYIPILFAHFTQPRTQTPMFKTVLDLQKAQICQREISAMLAAKSNAGLYKRKLRDSSCLVRIFYMCFFHACDTFRSLAIRHSVFSFVAT
jgi:hypothetical protein